MKSLIVVLLVSLFSPICAQPYLKEVAKGFERPIDLAQLTNGSFLVIQQDGKIFHTKLDGKKEQVLDWSDRVTRKDNEQGLLGIALAADFSKTGRIYLNLNNKKGATEIWRLSIDPENPKNHTSDPELLLSFDQPYGNHNGGWISIGPDGFLYIGTGDGGAANDPQNHAQDLTSYLGKILRLSITGRSGYSIPYDNPQWDVPGAKYEIFAYGLRNPWRCSWHDGTLFIGDVGQNSWEEINAVSLSQLKGANFGWRPREGEVATPGKAKTKKGNKVEIGGEIPEGAIDPIYVYSHDASDPTGGLSVTGGYLYEGPVAEMKGRYIFADFALHRIWSFVFEDGEVSDFQNHTDSLKADQGKVEQIASFAEDKESNLYLLCFSGSIFMLSEKE